MKQCLSRPSEVVDGLVGGMMVEVMLDSRHDIAKRFNGTMRYAKANAGLGRRRRASHCELRQGGSEAKRHRRGTGPQSGADTGFCVRGGI